MITLRCDQCGTSIDVNEKEILEKLDPMYPARMELITCPRCHAQLALQARKILHTRGQV